MSTRTHSKVQENALQLGDASSFAGPAAASCCRIACCAGGTICGVLFLILAIGNFLSTIATITSKLKRSRRRSAKALSSAKKAM